jgi:flavin-dependent dehydrogenase
MVNVSLPADTDVFVIGGGPAGLAAALAARQNGFEVVVADRAHPAIDKACGEGLMPDGVAALRRIGVRLGCWQGLPFRGIRFVDNELEAEACFPNHVGLGIRRTLLHQALVERAEQAGVVTCWQTPVDALDPSGVTVGGQIVRCRWIIGADGIHSRVRRWAGLRPVWSGVRRMGLRQHFRVRPWTDLVEVFWHRRSQAYVTPVGPEEVCVALIGSAEKAPRTDMAALFPQLAERLARAEPMGSPRGAISISTKLGAVTRGRIALIGDASGSVDAVTGDGLALAFHQATSLGAALAAGDLSSYEISHRRIDRMPRLMERLLLLMDGSDGFRRRALRAVAARPTTFSRLLAVHVGALRPWEASFDLFDFALRLLALRTVIRPSM